MVDPLQFQVPQLHELEVEVEELKPPEGLVALEEEGLEIQILMR
jgi:hypothetical protein